MDPKGEITGLPAWVKHPHILVYVTYGWPSTSWKSEFLSRFRLHAIETIISNKENFFYLVFFKVNPFQMQAHVLGPYLSLMTRKGCKFKHFLHIVHSLILQLTILEIDVGVTLSLTGLQLSQFELFESN